MTDHPGRFRINWVAENTGVAEATLRAWERRYQVPKPSRTPSGYRLYSPDDVALVRKMRELCEAGVAPAEAAKQLQLDQEEGTAAAPAAAVPPAPAVAPATGMTPSEDAQGMMEVVTPMHTNAAGVLAVSHAVALMERAASVAAARSLRTTAVVVSCGSVDLLVPVAPGQLIEAIARVVGRRENTISVDVELKTENVQSGERDHVARTTLLLVALQSSSPAASR